MIQINNTPTQLTRSNVIVGGVSRTIDLAPMSLLVQVGLPGDPFEIEIFGQQLSGVAVFEQRKTAAGAKIVRIAFTEVSLFIGDPGPTSADTDDIGLRLTGGLGAFVITPNGTAGEVSGAVALVGLPLRIQAELTLQLNSIQVADGPRVRGGGTAESDEACPSPSTSSSRARPCS